MPTITAIRSRIRESRDAHAARTALEREISSYNSPSDLDDLHALLEEQRIAEVERDDRHDHVASMTAWQTLLDRATRGEVEFAAMSAVRARIGLAAELVATAQPQRAVDLLAPVTNAHPAAPYGAEALGHFVLGRAHDAVNDRERAVIEWRRAIAIAPSDDPDNIRSRARTAIARERR